MIRRALIMLAIALSTATGASETLTLGVFAYRPKPVMQERYQPLADYLTAALGDVRVELAIYDADEIESALTRREIDLLMTNPSHYLVVRSRDTLSGALATVISVEGGQAVRTLGGVILARADRGDIDTLAALRGRRIGITGALELGGYQAQAFELLQAGLQLPKDADLVTEAGHDRVIEAVLEGRVDAGFVRTGVIESLAAEGRLDPAQLKIIHPQQLVGFPYRVSTRLYPEWPFVALPHVEQDVVRRLTTALLTLDTGHAAAQAAGIGGFAPPSDYLAVERLARELRLPPWNIQTPVTLEDVWVEYGTWISAATFGIAAIVMLLILLTHRNRQLVQLVREKEAIRRQLENSEIRLRNSLDGSPSVAVQWLDSDGRVLYWNTGSERLYAWRAHEALGRLRPELIHDAAQARTFDALLAKVVTDGGKAGPVELRAHDREDALRIVETTLFAIPGQTADERIFVCVDVDITERKRFERALTESRNHLNRLLATNPSVIYAMDCAKREHFFISGNAAGVLGHDPTDILSTPHWWNQHVHPEDLERARTNFHEWVANGHPGALRQSYRLRRGDGRWIWIEDQLAAVSGSASGAVELVGSLTDVSASRSISQELAETKSALEAALMNSPSGILIADAPALTIRFANAAASWMGRPTAGPRTLQTGIERSEFLQGWNISRPDGSPWPPDDLPLARAVFHGEIVRDAEMIVADEHGECHWISVSAAPIHDAEGAVRSGIVVFNDISARKEAEARLELAASVFSHAREAILITDAAGTILEINEAFTRITGHARDEAVGRTPGLLRSTRHGAGFFEAMWRELVEYGHWEGEIWNRRKDGTEFAAMLTIAAVRGAGGETSHFVALMLDITRQKDIEAQLRHSAHFDALTGLPNRLLLADRLGRAMTRAQRTGTLLAVAYIDLDGFKDVNDRYGHEAGDQVLVTVSARMRDTVREADTVARLGGDEFIAILADQANHEASIALVQRLIEAAAGTVHFHGHALQVTASVGLAFYPQAEPIDGEHLMRQADRAMYRAKTAGKNRFEVSNGESPPAVLD